MKTIVFAGGCFWGVEELFRSQPGVTNTEVGYTGGENDNPTYEFHPGHAEAIRITFDETKTSYATLLDYFFRIHDPTTLNRQGNDVGTSYRSAMFYADETEKKEAAEAIRRNQAFWDKPITTTLEPLTTFWSAEEYHQDYLQKHPGGYTCHYERARIQD
jgi:peptide-methionine (S)-S-oxide reductase